MQRLPIFYDDQSFRNRTERMFRDMQLQMDQDMLKGFGTGVPKWPLLQEPQSSSRLGGDDYFFQLKPRSMSTIQGARGDRGSQEILDDATVQNLFVEDPQHKSRVFRMSFDVNQYDPKEIQVRVEDRCLVVEAKHDDSKEGAKFTKEFCRKIQLPADVEPEKLTSTLSTDGILSIQAPVPPTYQNMITAGPGPQFLPISSTIPEATMLNPSQFSTPIRSSPISVQQQQASGPGGSSRVFQETTTLHTTPFQQVPVRVSPITVQQLSTSSSLGGPDRVMMGNTFPTFGNAPPMQIMQSSGPVTIPVLPCPSVNIVGLDRPVFTTTDSGRRRMDLVLELGKQFEASDLVVKIDGRRLIVEANHEKNDHGRISKSSMQREFDLSEDVDPTSVQAMMKAEGQLAIVAFGRNM